MAAKRLGQFLSNVIGTSGQILRVKSDESGFEMFTPAGLPTYTITNDTTDRVIDADVTTADELADVLATLIKDITTLVGGPVAFTWSTSEQVYPFEKDSSGRTLYCKEVNFGALPNNGHKQVAHNISGLTTSKIFKYEFYWSHSTIFISTSNSYSSTYTQPQINATYVVVDNNENVSAYSGLFRIIYAK